MHFSSLLSLAALFTAASCIDFINPPPPYTGRDLDFQSNTNYAIDSKINIQWTAPPKGKALSMKLQQRLESGDTKLSHDIFVGKKDITNYEWYFDTGVDIATPKIFFMELLVESGPGQSKVEAVSAFFNITNPAAARLAATSSSSTTLTTSTSTSSSSTSATSTSSPTPTLPPVVSEESQSEPASSKLSSSAIAGIGVGSAAIVLMGLAGLCFAIRRRRNRPENETAIWAAEPTLDEKLAAASHTNSNISTGNSSPSKTMNAGGAGFSPQPRDAMDLHLPAGMHPPAPAYSAPVGGYTAWNGSRAVEVDAASSSVYELPAGSPQRRKFSVATAWSGRGNTAV